ncbi:MAG: WhiB family transcriptional regulator [Bifidobacteriaceae bacterium]|jgi:WhiB family redox-sensing transcriptional regulator|nr:WhiB family transcriptional regulator [Bifidobacteriaceae bacterium]MCI1914390.1 WhiB family transcriptional regulator [Bifidobacteriaceae bacterium]MCI1935842.1 WhiB family transcriptional regulator [Bifidobacteriaceae bacterium]
MSATGQFRKTAAGAADQWKDHALCVPILRANPELFDRLWGFSDPVDRDFVLVGKKICGECPVREECLAEAIVDHRDEGIYGGFSLSERKYAARILESAGLMVRDNQWAGRTDRISVIVDYLRSTPSLYEDVRVMSNRLKRRKTYNYIPRRRSFSSRLRRPSTAAMMPLF